jgi:nucleoid-associated protein YgaU
VGSSHAQQRPRTRGADADPSRPRFHGRTLPLVLWLASLLAGIALFQTMGSGPLSPPPLGDPSSWQAWAHGREPLIAVVSVLRLLVLALAWYLVGVTTIGMVSRLTRVARLVRIADALTVPAVRRLLQGALGAGLATAMVGAAMPAAPPTPPTAAAASPDVAVSLRPPGDAFHPLTSDGARSARADRDEVRMVAAGEIDEVRMAAAGDADDVRTVGTDPGGTWTPVPLQLLEGDAPAGAVGAVSMRRVVEDPLDTAASYQVVAGDSLWTIAARTLEDVRGASPTDAELHGYWTSLIEVNRGRLADPDNPDLIFPGQPLVLPPMPADGGSPP